MDSTRQSRSSCAPELRGVKTTHREGDAADDTLGARVVKPDQGVAQIPFPWVDSDPGQGHVFKVTFRLYATSIKEVDFASFYLLLHSTFQFSEEGWVFLKELVQIGKGQFLHSLRRAQNLRHRTFPTSRSAIPGLGLLGL